MSKPSLWLVEIAEADWDYDRFECAAIWASSAEEAEGIIRAARRYPDEDQGWMKDLLWIESDAWKIEARPAPTEGVVLVHWHAG